MAFNYEQFGSSFGQQDYGGAFDSSDSFGSVFGGDATGKALDASRKQRQQVMTDMASGVIQQAGQYKQALAYAKGWQEQVDKDRRAAQKSQQRGVFGGIAKAVGAGLGFIPGFGQVANVVKAFAGGLG